MTHTIIKLVGLANGEPSPLDGSWLKSYDPSALGGLGLLRGTDDDREAKQFADAGEAFEFWRQQSSAHPTRMDGKPNRPLTAYSIEVVKRDTI